MASYVDRANRYARDVVSGKIPNCRWVKYAAKRHLDDLARQKHKDFPYRFDVAAAEKPCEFIEELPHVKGKWARKKQKIRLGDWQCFIVCVLFGWLKKKNGMRRFRRAYIRVPRKNGKSILAAGIGLYMWCMDGETGAEVYSGATTEKQAWEVFRPARLMLEKTEDLVDFVGGKNSMHAKSLVVQDDYSRFEPVIGKPGDGASPSCAIVDEYHEHDTPDLYDTMETGMLSREQPLLLVITTAGYNLAGPCYDLDLDAQKMLEGTMPAEDFFAVMYGIDESEYSFNGVDYKVDDWTLPGVLAKANPNFSISVDADTLESLQRQAVMNPAEMNKFKTKHLNIWCSARTAWMPLSAWHACADPSLTLSAFKGRESIFILDLASKDDIAAYTKLFWKTISGVLHFYAFAKYYIPEAALSTGPNATAYRKWMAMGLLHVCDGNEIEFDSIESDVKADKSLYQVREVLYDPWRATHLAQRLSASGAGAVVEYRQTVQNLSLPMKEVLSSVKAGRFHHDGNPVTTWMMSNVTAKLDAKDNIYPRKEKPHLKIDGAVTIIMGMGRAMLMKASGIDGWLNNPVGVK